jgi:hypothetical protein
VRELIPGDYIGTLVTDRFSSYEAEELAGGEQHKCLSHLIRNVGEVVESKTGRAKRFGSELKTLLQNANELWRQQRAGTVSGYADRAEQIEPGLTYICCGRAGCATQTTSGCGMESGSSTIGNGSSSGTNQQSRRAGITASGDRSQGFALLQERTWI